MSVIKIQAEVDGTQYTNRAEVDCDKCKHEFIDAWLSELKHRFNAEPDEGTLVITES